MAIKTYKKGDSTKLSENFRVSEFLCHGSGCCSSGKVDEKLVEILQKIRDHFGKPVHISSAYRCPTWNKAVGGVSGSYHLHGQAADIKVEDTAPAEVAKYAESIGVLGIGLYETDSDGYFVHVDTRTAKSFWYGHKQERRTTFGGTVEQTRPATTPAELEKDGLWGKDTTTRLQQIFGTPVDGEVSNQLEKYRDDNPGLVSGWDWQENPNGKGSKLIKEMQKWAGMPDEEQDGLIGPKTITAFQKKLGTTVDGHVSNPSEMVTALQHWANGQ